MAATEWRARHHLSAGDLDFVVDTLARTSAGRDGLLRLLADPQEIDRILDSERLAARLGEGSSALSLSSRLFFYLSVRRALRARGLEDRDLAEYLAGMLADFARGEHLNQPFGGDAEPLLLSIDLFRQVEAASDGQRFHLHASAGNHYLFMTSFFAGFIERRRERRGAPGLGYYEGVGRQSYARARDHRLAREYAMEDLFDALASAFPETRQALAGLNAQWGHAAA
jgi:hypothetical protein